MIKDADKIQTPTLRSIPMAFLCPPGFEPAAFLITAINQSGQSYTNAPIEQPHLTLHLATLALNFASQLAVKCMQTARQKESPILQMPAGSIPPWDGPAGRG